MIHFLKSPYPFEYSVRKSIWIIAGASLFVTLFLFLFMPFELHLIEGVRLFNICLYFGLSTGTVLAVFYFLIIPLFPGFFNEESWTIIRHILWVSTLFMCISLANSLLMYMIELRNFTWTTFLTSFWQVTALGVIISALIVPIDYLRHYKANQKEAEQVPKLSDSQSKYNNIFKFESENQKEQLRLSSDELLYLTSADNYVEVVFSEGLEVSKKLLRGTLARAEEQIHDPNIIRCHRSYIVNLHKVISVSGNAQGFQLTLRGTDRIIPVSTTYKKEVMRLLKG
ncbi:MAG: hypothetical protein GVY02_06530 [Bacteroidetes bacterium]|jgi:hypothetical protein|nr:hypothetical protein [Bacteroidota bacterium]